MWIRKLDERHLLSYLRHPKQERVLQRCSGWHRGVSCLELYNQCISNNAWANWTVRIATRHHIDSISDVNKELEDPVDTCGLDCWLCIVLDTWMTRWGGNSHLWHKGTYLPRQLQIRRRQSPQQWVWDNASCLDKMLMESTPKSSFHRGWIEWSKDKMPVEKCNGQKWRGKSCCREERITRRAKIICSRGKHANKERYFPLVNNTHKLNVCRFRLPRNLASHINYRLFTRWHCCWWPSSSPPLWGAKLHIYPYILIISSVLSAITHSPSLTTSTFSSITASADPGLTRRDLYSASSLASPPSPSQVPLPKSVWNRHKATAGHRGDWDI